MSRAEAGRVRIVVVGDALLDRDVHGSATRLAPDAPVPVVDEEEVRVRPGGAGLAAALAAADGAAVTLVTALGDDAAGRELAGALRAAGVEVVDLGLAGVTPEKIRVHAAGRPVVRLDRGGRPGARIGPVSATARAAVGWAQAVLVSDYGRGVAAEPGLRTVLARAARDVPLVWDPHPRGPEPVPGAAVCTPNDAEARAALPGEDPGEDGAAAAGRRAGGLARRWDARAVCVTRGAQGAVLATPDAPPVVLAAGVVHGDPCGAGDRFGSRLAAALAGGAHPAEAARL
ncbi:MAG: D-beta-D-heptose 7-phosphate kinase / D-beta-D-heptose 1-phosphate adenosyltransferase, partial [Solirubrobacteraceae bacterium]|nr:D-beta-D-heptose 7-phosphate kinase / D-beta-D-heptose 1-phosphate adenosyltransferase [Solirubrobacteraceae bacterium]